MIFVIPVQNQEEFVIVLLHGLLDVLSMGRCSRCPEQQVQFTLEMDGRVGALMAVPCFSSWFMAVA